MERVLDRWHQVGWDSQNSNDVEFSKEKTLRNSWKIWVFFGYAFEFSVGVFVGLAISNCSRQLLHNNGNQHFIFLQQHRKSYIYIYSRYPPWNQQDPWKLVLGKRSFLFGVYAYFWSFCCWFWGFWVCKLTFFLQLGHPILCVKSHPTCCLHHTQVRCLHIWMYSFIYIWKNTY